MEIKNNNIIYIYYQQIIKSVKKLTAA